MNELLSYEDFGNLRMRDFWPHNTTIYPETGVECCIGYGNGEAVGFCHFLWPSRQPGRVAEIRLEAFGPDDCPESVAEKLLQVLNLPVRPGMAETQVRAALGEPIYQSNPVDDVVIDHFYSGNRWPFRVICTFRTESGLVSIIIVRADLYRI
jgi:hypothetical protein